MRNGKTIRMVFHGCSRIMSKVGGDLISTAPATVLMKEGLIGFAAKTKTRKKPDGRPCGGIAISLFLTKTGSQLGFAYSEETRGPPRDFWIGRPLVLESEL